MSQEQKKKKRFGIIGQIYLLALSCMVVSAVITYSAQYRVAERAVMRQEEEFAFQTSTYLRSCVQLFTAYEWLYQYWYEHADDLDIVYDVSGLSDATLVQKYQLLSEHNPGIQIQNISAEAADAMTPEDQKLLAEISYSRLNIIFNDVKRSHEIAHLYCIATDTDSGPDPFGTQFFLLSAAGPGESRGTGLNDVFTLGKVITLSNPGGSRTAMRSAYLSGENEIQHFDHSGSFEDYYMPAGTFGDKCVLIGVSYANMELTDLIHTQAKQSTMYAVFYELILLHILFLFMYLYEIRPLKRVLNNIALYTENKDSASVAKNLESITKGIGSAATRNNEIGQLAEDFTHLTKEIDDYVAEIEIITARDQHIKTEMDLAASIQNSMLKKNFPLFSNRDEFDVYALMDPAREIGGDFYDFIMVDEDHLALVIADVSGKGIPAALFMMMAMVIVQSYSQLIDSPAEILEKANDAISAHNTSGMFVTAWIGILEISTGRMVCANAGHEYPVFMKPGGSFELYKDPHGFVIGALANRHYKEYELLMEPGSKLLVYTDGAREAMDVNDTTFGTDRIVENLEQLKAESPKEIVEGLHRAVEAYEVGTEQFDDITLLCIEYFGTENAE